MVTRFFVPQGPFALGELAALAQARLCGGDPERPIRDIAALADATPEQVTFLDNPKYLARAGDTRAAACLVRPAHADRLHLAADGVFALFDKSLRLGRDARDRPIEPHGRIDGVGQKVARNAGAGVGDVQTPEARAALGYVRGDRPILQVGRPVVEGTADTALVDDLLGQGDGRNAAVVEPDHVGNAGFLHRRRHFFGLGDVHG